MTPFPRTVPPPVALQYKIGAHGIVRRTGTTAFTPIAPVGDLGAIDATSKVFYYLGDGLNGSGTTLVGLGTKDGSQVSIRTVSISNSL